jgi:hypothetical protein
LLHCTRRINVCDQFIVVSPMRRRSWIGGIIREGAELDSLHVLVTLDSS